MNLKEISPYVKSVTQNNWLTAGSHTCVCVCVCVCWGEEEGRRGGGLGHISGEMSKQT